MATVFELTEHFPTGTTFSWDFGEPAAPGDKKSSATGVHQYCMPGTYTVKVTIQSPIANTPPVVLTEKVIIGKLPYIYLGKDKDEVKKTICSGQGVELNAFGKVARPAYPIDVIWYPKGETTDNIKVTESGCYSVKITEPQSGCTAEAKMQIEICGERDPDQVLNRVAPAWYIGTGGGFKWESGPDNPTPTTGRINVPNGVAVMTDPTNSIIYYTDGQKVFDRDNNPITYTKDPAGLINGDISNSQGVTTMPKTSCKGCQSEYYIFTLKKNAANENQIYYSIVDMKLNKGKGGLSVINQLLSPVPSTERLVASQGGSGFYWLISQDANSNTIRTFKVSDAGISAPTITNPSGSTALTNSAGNTKISVDWAKMAVVVPAPPTNKIDLFDFDATGKGTPTFLTSIDLGQSSKIIYGVEYSQDKKVLYVSLQGDGTNNNKSQILQFDISTNDPKKIIDSQRLLFETDSKIGALQIDPIYNTIIFVAILGSPDLGKITNTNGLLSNDDLLKQAKYEPKAATFVTDVTSNLGLPPSIPSPPNPSSPPTIKQSCEGTTFIHNVDKKLCDPMNNDKIVWRIYHSTLIPLYDPKTGLQLIAEPNKLEFGPYEGQELKYDFKKSGAGKYVITATISNVCVKDFMLDPQEFDVELLEPLELKTEYNTICKSDLKVSLTSIPPQKTINYEWSNGEKGKPEAIVKNPGGVIEVEVSDTKSGCSIKKKTNVNFLWNQYSLPQPNQIICTDDKIPLTIFPRGTTKDFKFEWKDDVNIIGTKPFTSSSVQVKDKGEYIVNVTDAYGCGPFQTTILVEDKCDPVILVPTIFTPNGDKLNDTFFPIPKNPIRTQIVGVQIFNRWGEMLFFKETNLSSAELAWDGKFSGQLVPPDTYAWVVQYKSIDFPEKGVMTLRGAVVVAY
ncbi:T9SS type B sorting domain-containing protein [Aquirufa nivalisilvae]|uniref:T9SS type B sorting domain-containing protein n=1 Tax=Aquirufa nivalisilvae TaxID=2516557 RepID=UPI0022A934EE|nr:T9SS type B sorting domain-containing protein [Aquirufa nivalisilvae]MCZ2480632.1 T9SS type B sorting domain-containing protein [Aquirufa nivalisilvae]